MCQKVFYTYVCKHMECSTFPCDKRNCCVHGPPKNHHVFLDDQLCHDCNEKSRQMRQDCRRRESCQDLQSQSRPQSQMQNHDQQQTGQTQQQQAFQDSQSISPDGKKKAIRPLETNKLANMDCRMEGNFGLTPSDVYYFSAAHRM
ncbi:hypothetical protein CkaCkLH20_09843 [Colletotrichum karsti]|uniref:Uncharacterized protein n=1 Tax=Colletotrichum karsti TaxID=1095194 RepID=A0A9P6HYB4_9PEZI|nr:uncharacterized protein CkaCkLH20_09843 [Colletotrichum karsti]KAF9872664.1 hypothetical protein CkaCkLH20_09843 [Colletotrichum karsti]